MVPVVAGAGSAGSSGVEWSADGRAGRGSAGLRVVFERFTPDAKHAVVYAQEVARQRGARAIDLDDLWRGVLSMPTTVGSLALAELGASPVATATAIASAQGTAPPAPQTRIPFTKEAKRAIERAVRNALSLGDQHIGTEHLVLGFLDVGGSVGWRVLRDAGIDATSYRARLLARSDRSDAGGKFSEARQNFDHALRAYRRGDGEEALARAEKAIEVCEERGDPSTLPYVQNLLAWIVTVRLLEARYAEALELAERAVAAVPGQVLFRGTRAAVLTVLGRGPEEIGVTEQVLTVGDDQLGDDRGVSHSILARAYLDAGDLDRAQVHAVESDRHPHPWPIHADTWRRIDERASTWLPPSSEGSAF